MSEKTATKKIQKKSKRKNSSNLVKDVDFRIVAIGASAGGLEALKEFFTHVPADCIHSFVIIQHLSPDYKSLMAELLAKNATLPIYEIKNDMEVHPGCIYLIPPKKNMTIIDGRLMLTNKPDSQHLNLPIDIFFRSLAQEYKEKSICIVLSGTGSDGTSGARAIKEVGGMIMVQDPQQAKFDGMPQSAINTGLVDYTLPVEQLPAELNYFIDHPKINGASENQIEKDEETVNRILHQIHNVTKLDFKHYKRPTLVRRIARRISVNKFHNLKEYLDFLFENTKEVHILAREFLIGVTKFFRDGHVWDKMESRVIPDIVRSKAFGEVFKIWCVGTSTGEEAYSLAISISEEMERQGKTFDVKIFATDLASPHLDIGSRGVYPESIIADVSKDRLAKYFNKKGDEYQVTNMLRRMVIFSQHNVLRDPPFNKMDLAVCRNLLIYMQPIAQRKIIGLLHYALNQNGILLLGTSETIGDYKSVMQEVDRTGKIYQNIKAARSMGMEPLNYPDIQKLSTTVASGNGRSRSQSRMSEIMNETIAEELGLAGVYVDANYNIIHAVGEFKKFVELPEKGFSVNLLSMLPDSMSISLGTAVRKALKNDERVLHKSMKIPKEDRTIVLDVLINPFETKSINGDSACLLLFIPKEEQSGKARVVREISEDEVLRIKELEDELKVTRENLQTVVQEVEMNSEELQATNEELLSANEELQSTNEELQSVNEELHTVNAELQQKIEDLAGLNADMDNLLQSTDIGTIFLDREMRIRKFTPSIREHFNLRDSDIDRPINHFKSNFGGGSSFYEQIQNVLDTGESYQTEIYSDGGNWFLKRITPYQNNNRTIDGAVISFVDINELKNVGKKFINQNSAFEQVLESSMAGYWDWMIQDGTEYLSPTFKQMFGYEDHEMENKPESWQKITHPDDLPKVLDVFNQHVESRGKIPFDNYVRYYHKDGSILWIYKRGKVIEWDKNGKPIRMVGSHVNITPLKNIEEELSRSNRELEQFAYVASHDLQEPLNTITDFVRLFEKQYRGQLDEEGDQFLGFILQAANRMSNLVKDVLVYSRIGSDKEITDVDCNPLVEEIQADFSKIVKDTKTTFEVGPLPTIRGHKMEIHSLFLNLISNSIKFRKDDFPPLIKIKSEELKQYWKFSIEDNGIGIQDRSKKKVFNIFQRLNNMDSYEGTGIGLAQCKKIVELHNGEIWLESDLGRGSTFYFTIKK